MAKLPSAVEKKLYLKDHGLPVEYDDENAPAYVVVRQATRAEQERIEHSLPDITYVYRNRTDGDTPLVEVRRRPSELSVQRAHVYATLSGCNIMVQDYLNPDQLKPLFRFKTAPDGKLRVDMTEEEFALAWGLLPPEWAEAILNAVYFVNPQWRANF